MIIYLASFKTIHHIWDEPTDDIWLLSSYVEFKDSENVPDFVKQDRHLLDSGAFTYLRGTKGIDVDWETYVDQYGEFVVDTDQRHFFELDLYDLIGVERTEALRDRLEQRTGRQCIPVWHKSLGADY